MTFDEIRKEIDSYMMKLPGSKTKLHEAEDLSSEFLVIQHKISDTMLILEEEMNELRAVGKMLYNNALMTSDAKNAPEKKAQAEASSEYSQADKMERNFKARLLFLKTKLSIFNDAHLCCRQIARNKEM